MPRNPFKPGELMDRAAKPAYNKVKVRALKMFDMGILALIFGSLASHKAPPLVFFVAVILYCGWPVTLILAGAIARSRSPKGKSVESINPGKTS